MLISSSSLSSRPAVPAAGGAHAAQPFKWIGSDARPDGTLPLWQKLQDALADGFWQAAQKRSPAPGAAAGGKLGQRLRVAVRWAMEVLETSPRVLRADGRHRELVAALERIAWLMQGLMEQDGEARAWLALAGAFDWLMVAAQAG
jgi:hypothetical protein